MSAEEEAMLRDAVIEAPVPRKKVVPKSSFAACDERLRKIYDQIETNHKLSTWKIVCATDNLIVYLNQPQIDELSLRY